MKTLQKLVSDALARWARDSSASSVSDFAVLLPVMLALLLGGFEVTNLILVYRKMCDVTAQLANIASQTDTPSQQTLLQSDMSAVSQVMYPYSVANLTLVMSEIDVNGDGQAWVGWSEGWQGGAINSGVAHATGAPGSWTSLPSQMVNSNIASNVSDCATGSGSTAVCYSYILVESSYTYHSTIGGQYVGFNIPLANHVYFPPRNETSIQCDDASNANVSPSETYC